MILTASRDKTIIVWQLTREDANYGYPKRELRGHNGFVSDVVISSDGQFALSASWDKTLRLWDLNTGSTTRRFVGHTADVLSVSFSADNRQIVSGSRDRTIKLWNTLGECKFNIQEDGHSEWVSCVRFSPNPLNPVIVSSGWDKVVKVSAVFTLSPLAANSRRRQSNSAADPCDVAMPRARRAFYMMIYSLCNICYFRGTIYSYENISFYPPRSLNHKTQTRRAFFDLVIATQTTLFSGSGADLCSPLVCQVWELSKCKLRTNHFGHTGYINTVTVSPDGSLCASGGKDGITMLWDLNEGKHLYSLEAGDEINALVFSPNRYWLCAATSTCIKIFDLESKSIVDELKPDFLEVGKNSAEPQAVSLSWSADGATLFAGYTDNVVRVYTVV